MNKRQKKKLLNINKRKIIEFLEQVPEGEMEEIYNGIMKIYEDYEKNKK